MSCQSQTTLLVSERGAQWPSWVERLDLRNGVLSILVQQRGETLAALASRVSARVAKHAAFDRLVIACGGRSDADALRARSNAIRAAVGKMITTGQGRVVLGSEGTDRTALAALAASTTEMIAGTGVTVTMVDAADLKRAA